MNMARMRRSAERVSLPDFDADALIELIMALVKLDEHLIPPPPCALYMRPTMIGTRNTLGVAPSTCCLLYVILSPVGPFFPQKKPSPLIDSALSSYGGSAASTNGTTTPVTLSTPVETSYPSGMTLQPVALLATTSATRSWPGGVGSFKLAGNYSPCFKPQMQAIQRGYQQNLWCIDESAFTRDARGGPVLQECGQMNLFIVFKDKDGRGDDGEGVLEVELATPGLETETILPGVTRDSVLALARQHADGTLSLPFIPSSYKVKVSERQILLSELVERSRNGEVLEVFGTGTAAVICPIGRVGLEDGSADLDVPSHEGGLGPVARATFERLAEIQEGRLEHPWCVPCV
jgi:branched-chain amino acid aminotransferase